MYFILACVSLNLESFKLSLKGAIHKASKHIHLNSFHSNARQTYPHVFPYPSNGCMSL